MTKLPKKIILIIIASLLALALLFSISVGAVSIPFFQIISFNLSQQQEAVLLSIRLPRALLAIIVGASLAVSGAAIQGIFRNPLADPGLIGISSGAALGVGLMIVFAGPLNGILGIYGLSFAAFIGGLLTCLLIMRFAFLAGAFSVTYMLLAGIAINSLAGAATGFMTYLSNDEQLRSLTFWTMGGLGGALWSSVLVAFSVVVPTTIMLIIDSKKLNILLLGDSEAKYLGINIKSLKKRIIICTVLSVGASVSISGIIGFVGLVVPHLIRLTFGSDNRWLIPLSALLGALLLLIADTFARTIVSPAEVPVGIITSLIGGPFFLWLLVKQYSNKFGV
ncbi:MAG: iron complex transport system permease protein [Rickettsiales bacterium]